MFEYQFENDYDFLYDEYDTFDYLEPDDSDYYGMNEYREGVDFHPLAEVDDDLLDYYEGSDDSYAFLYEDDCQ